MPDSASLQRVRALHWEFLRRLQLSAVHTLRIRSGILLQVQRGPRPTPRDPRPGQWTLRTSQTPQRGNAPHPTLPTARNRGQATNSQFCQLQRNKPPSLPTARTRGFVKSTNKPSGSHHGRAATKRHHPQSIGHSQTTDSSNSCKMAKSYRHFCSWSPTSPTNYNKSLARNSAQHSPANADAAFWQPIHWTDYYKPVPGSTPSPGSCQLATP